jgi:hypothetical protein
MQPRSPAPVRARWVLPLAITLGSMTLALSAGTFAVVRAIDRGRAALPALPQRETSRVVVVRPAPDVLRAVRDLARLETASFQMERVIEVRDEQQRLWGLVEGTDTLLLVASGEVRAGIDLRALTAGDIDVDWEHRRASLRLPAPEVLSTSIDNARTYTHARSTSLFARRNEALDARARLEAERALRQGALDRALLDHARQNAERELRSLLTALGFSQVSVSWRDR